MSEFKNYVEVVDLTGKLISGFWVTDGEYKIRFNDEQLGTLEVSMSARETVVVIQPEYHSVTPTILIETFTQELLDTLEHPVAIRAFKAGSRSGIKEWVSTSEALNNWQTSEGEQVDTSKLLVSEAKYRGRFMGPTEYEVVKYEEEEVVDVKVLLRDRSWVLTEGFCGGCNDRQNILFTKDSGGSCDAGHYVRLDDDLTVITDSNITGTEEKKEEA